MSLWASIRNVKFQRVLHSESSQFGPRILAGIESRIYGRHIGSHIPAKVLVLDVNAIPSVTQGTWSPQPIFWTSPKASLAYSKINKPYRAHQAMDHKLERHWIASLASKNL
mgnify:CR=1 FL=1